MRRHKVNGDAADLRRIGAEIARRMAVARMKPAELASASGLDDSQMSKVLAGRAGLSLASLGRIAQALGCSRAEILAAADGDTEPPPARRRPAPSRRLRDGGPHHHA